MQYTYLGYRFNQYLHWRAYKFQFRVRSRPAMNLVAGLFDAYPLIAGLFDAYPKASSTKMIAGLFDAYSLLEIGT